MVDELQAAKELAVRAGGILLEYHSQEPSVGWKGRGDPVTTADSSVSDFLMDELRRRFPHDGILCEEEKDDLGRLGKSRVWIVDPMDGTAEFIARRGEFAVMIGFAVDGKPQVGVVCQPTEGKLYYAAAGAGAFLQQGETTRSLRVSPESDTSNITIAVSRSHESSEERLVRQILNIDRMLRSGSAGLKVGMICERRAHLYLHTGPHTKQWDTCAPEVILHEAGGRITDTFNAPLQYNVPDPRNLGGVIASNGVVHSPAVEAVKLALQQLGRTR